MSYSSISILVIPLITLLLIPGLDSMSTAFAQYDIPNMDDFEIPSQEEIEKMMEQQEVSGKYVNSDFGIEVMIPLGWSGMASDFKNPTTGEWISGFQAMEGGINANLDSMQRGD